MKTYQIIAHALDTLKGSAVDHIKAAWQERLEKALETMPSGSGFDHGTKLDDSSTPDRLVFLTAFHHMTEHGYYSGWTEHKVIVIPDFVHGIALRVTGRDRNEIKGYIAETFQHALTCEAGQ